MRAMRSDRPRELASPVVPRMPRPLAPCASSQREWAGHAVEVDGQVWGAWR